MSGWSVDPSEGHAPAAPGGAVTAVTAVVAAPSQQAQALYVALLGDARFRILAMASSPEDLTAKVAMQPEALLVDGALFPGPDALARALGGYDGVAFVLLPAGVPQPDLDAVRAVACVRDVVAGEANFSLLAGRLYDAVAARRAAAGRAPDAFGRHRTQSGSMIGHRRIAVWSLQGGVGKSTLAAALALEAASRRLPTLLIGLGAPDPIPLALDLRPDPNLGAWQANPTPEGLRAAVQKLDVLDVLAGFYDPLALTAYLPDALDGGSSVPALADCAAQAGYAVVVLDLSAPELAAAALSAANTLLLVAAPTLPGALHAVEAVRLLNDVMAGRHRIAPQAMHLVINRLRASTLTPEELLKAGSDQRRDFPPLAASVADDPEVELALNRKRPAYYHSEPLRRAAQTLGDLLLAVPADRRAAPAAPGKVYTLGPIRVRV